MEGRTIIYRPVSLQVPQKGKRTRGGVNKISQQQASKHPSSEAKMFCIIYLRDLPLSFCVICFWSGDTVLRPLVMIHPVKCLLDLVFPIADCHNSPLSKTNQI